MQLNMLEAMNIYVNVVEQGSFIRAAEVLELVRVFIDWLCEVFGPDAHL
ncbi:hypothetical protein ACLIYC_000984 [Salmonella enterica subsp. enterica serovar Montevideo]